MYFGKYGLKSPNLQVGAYLYKITFDKIVFHVDKLQIVDIVDNIRSHFILCNKCYVCDNGDKFGTFYLDSMNCCIVNNKRCWICSNINNTKECIKRHIDESIKACNEYIENTKKELKFWENKKRLYEA